jgi:hypothetical protein
MDNAVTSCTLMSHRPINGFENYWHCGFYMPLQQQNYLMHITAFVCCTYDISSLRNYFLV